MFAFGPARGHRRPSLTPMIDVVFLLLVFFMLAARFGQDMTLPLVTGGAGAEWSGPPRLIEIAPDTLRLNGAPVGLAGLPVALDPLMTRPDEAVVLRPLPGASLQRLMDVTVALRAAGLTRLVVVE
ncbi:biopolymer transport protein ExbD [Roseovarius azorensis]|uniref:Biopolymer transport protein ExbD n=1 Tax=Roseovarius azorensis TaxID=1287727 RepID=A0A1H7HSY3_9RHOB|nr:biopolymer transporter ExbD [Roseovarius azorensis]SEK52757.1 biopolymer transport protein ExbD [Roseovarius azorensis]